MIQVRPAQPRDYEWLASRAHLVPDSGFRALKAIDEQGRILAMVGYDSWGPNGCCIHIALERPTALRHVLYPGFRIPFRELGVGVLVAKVVSTNAASLRLVSHLGFREVGRVHDWAGEGVDLVVHEMRRSECRYLEA